MILTVTLNPALDVTYTVDRLAPHTVHRVREVAERPGGKGLNVAGLLHTRGEPVTATGLLGGHTGERIADLLAAEGVPAAFTPLAGESRRTLVVREDGEATGFWEPGPTVTPDEWSDFHERFQGLLADAMVVALCGSLPSGVPADAYATLIADAHRHGVPVVLDADGEPLRLGLAARPTVVKPNLDELAAVIGHRPGSVAEAVTAAARLAGSGTDSAGGAAARPAGHRTVVASLGRDGLVAVTDSAVFHAAAPPQRGNPTGAGDAVVAALTSGLLHGTAWPDVLRDAAAYSAAAVLAPVAGVVPEDTYQRLRDQVTVTELPLPPEFGPTD